MNAVLKFIKNNYLIIIILAFSLFIRMWKLDSVPPALGNDEISIAYEAYSIVNTGKDSTGEYMPLSFKSNGSSKAPLYIYVAAPFIKIFGNNEVAVRLPSVIFGSATILMLYIFVLELTNNKKLALISAALLGITPWHIYTSRIALESNLALFLTITGITLFLKGIKKKIYLYLSSIILSLSIYTYQTQIVFIPLMLLTLSVLFFQKNGIKKTIIAWVIFLTLLVPFFLNAFLYHGENRLGQVFILKDGLLSGQIYNMQNIAVKIYTIVVFYLNKFFGYINLDYIFIHGLPIDAPHGSPYFGLLNIIELPFFLIGIYSFMKSSDRYTLTIVAMWYVLSPLICSSTLGDFNLIRNLISVIPLTILSAYGICYVLPKKRKLLWKVVIALAIFINFGYFYRYYLKYFPIYHSEDWSYGFKDIALYVNSHKNLYDKIVISYEYGRDRKLYGVPSLFVLYYNNVNPQKFLDESKYNNNYLTFEKYEFRPVDWPKEKITPRTLYVVSTMSVPLTKQRVEEVYSIHLPEGEKAFSFYKSY